VSAFRAKMMNVMMVPTKTMHPPKWRSVLSAFVFFGGSTALCWLTIRVLTRNVYPFEDDEHDWLVHDICIVIFWCVCSATVSELLNDWRELRRGSRE
jgi:hypothetical protein